MAEYEDNLAAVQQSPVPEFFLFNASGTIERYTSYSSSLTFLGQYWTAASITRGGLKQDLNFGVTTLNITTPITPSIAKYIPNQPVEPIDVTIYRSHIDYLDQYDIFFRGKIKYVQLKGKLASAQCEAKNKYMAAKIPNIIYQSNCNHDIYDSGCKVDEFAYRRIANVSSIVGSKLYFSFTDGGGSVATGYFTGGKVKYGNDLRFITYATGAYLDLHIPFDSKVGVGTEVYIFPGCDGNPSTCVGRYSNLDNFLGMPYIPETNPVVWGFK